MAQYHSTVTRTGVALLAKLLASGEELTLTRACVGDGRSEEEPENRTSLVSELHASVQLGEKEEGGDTNLIRIPVQVSNAGLITPVYIREIGIFALQGETEILFSYSWLEGEDSDNRLAPPLEEGRADTLHIHDVGILLENGKADQVTVELSSGSYVTYSQVLQLTAAKDHRHTAGEINESTGETVEAAQRRQDYEIAALKEQLDTGFIGASFTHTFQLEEFSCWNGADLGYPPEGIYDTANVRLYA